MRGDGGTGVEPGITAHPAIALTVGRQAPKGERSHRDAEGGARMTAALVNLFCRSFPIPPLSVEGSALPRLQSVAHHLRIAALPALRAR